MTERKYFGTDGVRAVAGEFPLTGAWVFKLGAAAGEVLKRDNARAKVVIGKDTRQSGDMLEAALAAGLTSRGVDVIHVGVLPTPGVSYLTRHLGADAGVVISASHNPYQDNGIKFFGRSGGKLSDALEAEIERAIDAVESLPPVTGVDLGGVTDYTEAERLYVQYLVTHAPDLAGVRIAMDCANGAAYRVGPKVFQAAGADLFAVFTNPDGRNINRDCGSTHLERLQGIVRSGDFDLGVAFDGDADRCLFVDRRGNVVHGDHLLLLNARARGERGVATTIMSNMALEVKLQQAGITLERTNVGDRYVHERLHERGLHLGGEQSGHMLFLDVSPTGDGVLTALLSLASMRTLGTTLDELYDDLEMFPQTLVNVRVQDKRAAVQAPDVQAAVRAAEERLAGRGRVNLRPSGTENLVRVMVEGPDAQEIHEVAQGIAALLQTNLARA
ncbi:phosphoglucosamine mutase [Deinococcus maricopensis]|uniref:Phosphoglucosamine mutase n=1 Tax=Deinococcus maricopensis (strain DSM 21211 / LMG 22137 / NRRL B-23946 / LB-34) TaxID=709986 RepID=E8U6J6_DEIML|nr:phosphoglucosamine mutase [Deinococcus maricopensis]ADV66685.1 phosphoglucosamine mutase [Deinococcus maricopensis DSM 21211]